MSPRRPSRVTCWAIGCFALGWSAGLSMAQESETQTLRRPSVDGGADRVSGATFELSGTVGQFDAGPIMRGGTLSLRGGFHITPRTGAIFSDGFED